VAEFSLDPRKCFAVGDSPRDIIPAEELGCRTVLLTTKPLEAFSGELSFRPSALRPTLLDAVRWILSQP
jgi:FMN phosphatase YigB (HAD superfamily)